MKISNCYPFYQKEGRTNTNAIFIKAGKCIELEPKFESAIYPFI